MFKKKIFKKMVYPFTLMLVMTILLSYVSYSWIKREWTPSIHQDGILITTNGSLVLNLGDSDEYQEEQSINEILNVNSFVLQPVSNATGESEDFFTLDFGGGPGNEMYTWLNLADYGTGTKMGVANGYIEFFFTLYAPGSEIQSTRYVYIDEESYIECDEMADAAKAIRMSISVSTDTTKIFSIYTKEEIEQMKPVAITNDIDSSTNRPKADSAKYYSFYDSANEGNSIMADTIIKSGTDTGYDLYESVKLNTLSDFYGKNDQGEWDTSRTLFPMQEGKNAVGATVTVRIWVEGTDPNCTSNNDFNIAGKAINLKLKFGSFSANDLA